MNANLNDTNWNPIYTPYFSELVAVIFFKKKSKRKILALQMSH